jgi:PAS domain S-box-containing protein
VADQDLHQELRRRELLIDRLIEAMPGGVVHVTREGAIQVANPEAQRILGLSFDELTRRFVTDFDRETIWEDGTHCAAQDYPVSRALQTGQRQGPDVIGVRQKSGELAWAVFTAIPVHDPETGQVSGAVVTFLDITLRKRAERQLRESLEEREAVMAQKLESLGVLSGGIAHDFNNLLTSIWGRVSLARSLLGAKSVAGHHLDATEPVLKRAQRLTQQLLTFARGGAPVKESVPLAGLLREASQFSVSGSSARCEVNIQPDLWSAEVDSGQIFQAVNNILLNAVQAMPEGGLIELLAGNLVVGDAMPLPVRPGRYVHISIRDHGVGIERELLVRIFDPYFTTKPKGTGLGLAVAYSIVRKHGGTLSATSQPGQGTVFDIYLPAAAAPSAVANSGAAAGAPAPGPASAAGATAAAPARPASPAQAASSSRHHRGPARVLLMDDEPGVRAAAAGMLRRLGHTVTGTADGNQAVERYRKAFESRRPYDVVLMDLTVAGGTGGLEATRRILALDPQARVVVASGYSDDPVMSRYRELGFAARLAKPYDLERLEHVLGQVLNETPPASSPGKR